MVVSTNENTTRGVGGSDAPPTARPMHRYDGPAGRCESADRWAGRGASIGNAEKRGAFCSPYDCNTNPVSLLLEIT